MPVDSREQSGFIIEVAAYVVVTLWGDAHLVVIDLYSYNAFNFCFKVCHDPGMVWSLYLLLKRRKVMKMQTLQTEEAIECLIENAKKGKTAAEQCKEDPPNKVCKEMA